MKKKSFRISFKRSLFLLLGILLIIPIINHSIKLQAIHIAHPIINQTLSSKPVCANSISCIKDLSGNPEIDNRGVYQDRIVFAPIISNVITYKTVLSQTSNPEDKHIYVNLSTQRLYAYDGNKLILEFPVSTGKWSITPTGDFKIWLKLKATRMSGGNPAIGTYYNLPNVPNTMFFYNDNLPKSMGYSLHGAYWHNNFGHPMSHGCVNIGLDDAKKLFDWADPPSVSYSTYVTENYPGTSITIFGETPAE